MKRERSLVIQNYELPSTSLISKSLPIRPAFNRRALCFKHLARNHILFLVIIYCVFNVCLFSKPLEFGRVGLFHFNIPGFGAIKSRYVGQNEVISKATAHSRDLISSPLSFAPKGRSSLFPVRASVRRELFSLCLAREFVRWDRSCYEYHHHYNKHQPYSLCQRYYFQ